MPFMDLLNHSISPNVGIMPYVDNADSNHSYLIVKALKDIQ